MPRRKSSVSKQKVVVNEDQELQEALRLSLALQKQEEEKKARLEEEIQRRIMEEANLKQMQEAEEKAASLKQMQEAEEKAKAEERKKTFGRTGKKEN